MSRLKTHKIINSTTVVLLLIIYGFILVNNSFFYHSHVTSEGKVISHAHPFNKQNDDKPYKSHHHSKLELLLLFSNNYNTNNTQPKVKVIPITNFDNFLFTSDRAVISKRYSFNSSRAPPSLI
jgi:hypothetical protein